MGELGEAFSQSITLKVRPPSLSEVDNFQEGARYVQVNSFQKCWRGCAPNVAARVLSEFILAQVGQLCEPWTLRRLAEKAAGKESHRLGCVNHFDL